MKIWAVLPVKALNYCKSRLANVLAVEERIALVQYLLHRMLAILSTHPALDEVLVISRDEAVQAIAHEHGVQTFTETASADLNQALQEAWMVVCQAADYGLILPVDLPLLSAELVTAMVSHLPNAVIAGDDKEEGTNGLCLPTRPFSFQFGPASFTRHAEQLKALGYVQMRSAEWQFDLDTPEQWHEWQTTIYNNDGATLDALRFVRREKKTVTVDKDSSLLTNNQSANFTVDSNAMSLYRCD